MSTEYSLSKVLASKSYPQVVRVTRPYYARGKEYLRKDQYITILDHRKIELITGLDHNDREFRIRKDRSIHVEVLQEERIVYNLANIAKIEKHITAIELRKEIRYDQQTFDIGEKFTIEKVGKDFRGRSKNIALRRKRDGKIYRLPLDIIGKFSLETGKSILPLSKVLTLRPTPVSARFPNSASTTNFPTGVVKLGNTTLVDVVYILTVKAAMYQYEVITADSNIYVEICNLSIPKHILEIIPDGMFVNSAEYIQSINLNYKKMLSNIDSKLIEDIYSQIYYGSASFDKSNNNDMHLVEKPRQLTSAKSFNEVQLNHASPSSEFLPAPFPRHSIKSQHKNTTHFPPIKECDHLDKTVDEFKQVVIQKPIEKPAKLTTIESGTSMHDTVGRNFLAGYGNHNGVQSPTTPTESVRSRTSSVRSSSSDHTERESLAESCAKLFYNPHNGPPVMRRHSRSSSIATEDSFDSGVILTHTVNSAANSALNSPIDEKHSLYAFSLKSSHTNVRKITLPRPEVNMLRPKESPQQAALPHDEYADDDTIKSSTYKVNGMIQTAASMACPPLPARDTIYQNIHRLRVNENSVDLNSDYDDVRIIETSKNKTNIEPAYEELPYQNLSRFDFRSQSINEPFKRKSGKIVAEQLSKHFAEKAVSPPIFNLKAPRSQEIQYLSQQEVGELLIYLKLSSFVQTFARELINGQLLGELDEQMLIQDLQMSQFQARKLYKYIHGWRPMQHDINGNNITSSSSNPALWSVSKVVTELQNIHLQDLAAFCHENQIDGNFLQDLVETNIITSLRSEHAVSINGIGMSRLKAFVLKEWRPDSSDSSARFFENQNDHSMSHRSSFKTEKQEKQYNPLWSKITS